MHLLTCVNEKLAQRGVCQAFAEAPHIPASGASTAAMLREKLEADLLFLDDVITLHVMNVIPKYSFLVRARAKNPQEVRDAFCSSWIGVFGPH